MPLFLSTYDQLTWRQPQHFFKAIPAEYQPWLFDKGSLTQKLVQRSKGHFSVEVLSQSIRSFPLSEQRALGLPHTRWAVIREVILYGNQQPWVYARTAIPLTTLDGPLRRLHYLGNKPLGEQLFTDPTMQREPLEVAIFQPQHLPKQLALKDSTWGRRSVFRLSNKPLLVSEIFLPSLFVPDANVSE